LGDLQQLIPQIGSLIPLATIDLDAYNQIRAACPFLNLPPADPSGDANTAVASLRAQIALAYAQFTGKLLNHPWNRMGKLQDEMNDFYSKIQAGAAPITSFLQCLQAACAGVSAGVALATDLSNTNIGQEVTKYGENFVQNGGKVLSAPAQLKAQETQEAISKMKELGADVGQDYTDAKAALSSPATVQTQNTIITTTSDTTTYTDASVVPTD